MNFINELIVIKVHPTRASQSIPGSEYIQVDLMDIHDNFKYYKSYISDNLDNYHIWKEFFDVYNMEYCYRLEGMFRKKAPGRTKTGAKDIINGDAKFNVCNRISLEKFHEFVKEMV